MQEARNLLSNADFLNLSKTWLDILKDETMAAESEEDVLSSLYSYRAFLGFYKWVNFAATVKVQGKTNE